MFLNSKIRLFNLELSYLSPYFYFYCYLLKIKKQFYVKKYSFFFNKIKRVNPNIKNYNSYLNNLKFKLHFPPVLFAFNFKKYLINFKIDYLIKNNLILFNKKINKNIFKIIILKIKKTYLVNNSKKLTNKLRTKNKITLISFIFNKAFLPIKKLNLKFKMSLFISITPYLKFVIMKSFKTFKFFKKIKTSNYFNYENFINTPMNSYLKYGKYELKSYSNNNDLSIKRLKFKNNYIQL